jgi:hypothetical protein
MVLPAQLEPVAGGLLAFVGTFVLGALFYALTAHIAARYVLGDVPYSRALLVGIVPSAVVVLLSQYPILVILVVSFLADAVAIQQVYRLRARTAALVAVVHYTVTVLLVLTLRGLLSLLATAPG